MSDSDHQTDEVEKQKRKMIYCSNKICKQFAKPSKQLTKVSSRKNRTSVFTEKNIVQFTIKNK